MKVFDSLKTMKVYHDIFKNLSEMQQEQFSKEVFGLFDKKQISEDGEFNSFKITEKDLIEIANKVQGV